MPTMNVEDVELPSEIVELLKKTTSVRTIDRLDAIGKALATSKNEAVSFRETCGIEDTWAMCEDSYAGIDDANRHEHHANRWIKPTRLSR